jgi:SPP1 gp7 family putative phage head morphogenesis protein
MTMYAISARKTVERDIKLPFFITETDMEEIRRYTHKYQDWLWVGMEREIVKKTAMAFDPRTFMRMDPSKFELKDTFIGLMTQSLHGEIAADAVISKARQVIIGNNTRIRRRTSFRMAALEEEPHFVWRTAEDESTCPDCAELDGQVFAIDDPNVITPVEGTHPRCRCSLELVDASESEEIETIEDLFATNIF